MLTLPQQLLRFASYNAWANERLAEVLTSVPVFWLDQELKSSFPTLRKTAFHIWDGEYIWLRRMQGKSIADFPSKTFPPDTPVNRFAEGSQALFVFLNQQLESFFHQETIYHTFTREEFRTLNSDIVQHVLNHATFHRGQIITMLHACGFEGKLPSTDFIAWQRGEERKS
jgi:uncharacterized damage-inducible protein DinB